MKETVQFADLIAKNQYEDLPEAVINRAKSSIADSLACGLGGRKTREGDVLLDMMSYLGGNQEATVLGDKTRLPFMLAAQVNRVLMNMLDCDDTHMKSGHMSSALVPVALAVGERVNASGKDVINALVMGYETVSRIREAVNPTEEQFFSPKFERIDSGVNFGVTVVAGKLFGLTGEEMSDAIGLAGHVKSARITYPDMQTNGQPPWMKITLGDITIPGIHSALLAKRGFPGDRGLLDQERGYQDFVGSDRYNAKALLADWGKEYETLRIGYKLYSACRHTSSTADAVAALVREHAINAVDIESVVVRLMKRIAEVFGVYEPKYMIQAQFSIPHVVAMVLLREPTGPRWYREEMLTSPKVTDLRHRVRLEVDPIAAHKFYSAYKSTSTVEITTKDGKRFSKHVEFPKGEPENPLGPEEHETKIRNLAAYAGLQEDQINELLIKLDRLEREGSVRELVPLLVPEG
jgi:2-methylcitrate dehydratase PrpD